MDSREPAEESPKAKSLSGVREGTVSPRMAPKGHSGVAVLREDKGTVVGELGWLSFQPSLCHFGILLRGMRVVNSGFWWFSAGCSKLGFGLACMEGINQNTARFPTASWRHKVGFCCRLMVLAHTWPNNCWNAHPNFYSGVIKNNWCASCNEWLASCWASECLTKCRRQCSRTSTPFFEINKNKGRGCSIATGKRCQSSKPPSSQISSVWSEGSRCIDCHKGWFLPISLHKVSEHFCSTWLIWWRIKWPKDIHTSNLRCAAFRHLLCSVKEMDGVQQQSKICIAAH